MGLVDDWEPARWLRGCTPSRMCFAPVSPLCSCARAPVGPMVLFPPPPLTHLTSLLVIQMSPRSCPAPDEALRHNAPKVSGNTPQQLGERLAIWSPPPIRGKCPLYIHYLIKVHLRPEEAKCLITVDPQKRRKTKGGNGVSKIQEARGTSVVQAYRCTWTLGGLRELQS